MPSCLRMAAAPVGKSFGRFSTAERTFSLNPAETDTPCEFQLATGHEIVSLPIRAASKSVSSKLPDHNCFTNAIAQFVQALTETSSRLRDRALDLSPLMKPSR